MESGVGARGDGHVNEARRNLFRAGLLGMFLGAACHGAGSSGESLRRGAPGDWSSGVHDSGERVWGRWHCVSEEPELAEVYSRAYALHARGLTEEAIAALNVGLDRDPRAAGLFEARGALYACLGYRRAAERDFVESTRLAPDRAGAWLATARMRQELGLQLRALDALERSAFLGEDSATLHLIWARVLREQDFRGPAASRYVQVFERLPEPDPELLIEAASLCGRGEDVSAAALRQANRILARSNSTEEVEPVRPPDVRKLLLELARDPAPSAEAVLGRGEITAADLAAATDLALLTLRLDDPATRRATLEQYGGEPEAGR